MYSTDNFDFNDLTPITDYILKLDWKQLAILLLHITANDEVDYYTTVLDPNNTDFCNGAVQWQLR